MQSRYQNDKTDCDYYLYELNELWQIGRTSCGLWYVQICYCQGETDERIKVHKFWFGLRKEIQHDVRMEKLNLDSA